MPNLKNFLSFLIAAAIVFSAASAFAGGPFVVDDVNNSGVPARWKNDSFEWHSETGRFSDSVNNATAISWVTEALEKWKAVKLTKQGGQAVSTSVLSIRSDPAGSVGEDITVSNYGNYCANSDDPRTCIVFDHTGEIISEFMPQDEDEDGVPDPQSGVLGITLPPLSDSSGLYITKGITIFNGTMLANPDLAYDPQTFAKSVILHELGHLLNLDHSQVNNDIAETCSRTSNTCRAGSGNYIPTMYPILLHTGQNDLAYDDIITLSWIYPSADFTNNFCTITGLIYDANGNYLKGVNVIAKRVEGTTAPYVDARSFVSGAATPDCAGDSRYYLKGIVPGYKYYVTYEPIGNDFTGASDFEPLSNPPSDFRSGSISSTSDETSVSCENGGETIEMASVSINVTNPCTVSGEPPKESESTAQSSKCSLYPAGGSWKFPAIFLAAALAIVAMGRVLSPFRGLMPLKLSQVFAGLCQNPSLEICCPAETSFPSPLARERVGERGITAWMNMKTEITLPPTPSHQGREGFCRIQSVGSWSGDKTAKPSFKKGF